MKTLVIDTQAIRHNISVVKKRVRSLSIYGVLPGDAYGIGLVEAARLLREDGIGRFAVTEPEDALTLRAAGFLEEEILMLRSTTQQNELEQLLDANVICTIGSHEAGMALDALAKARSTAAEAHLQVNTGIGHGGFPAGEADKILSIYRYLPNVAISGLYTNLCNAEKDKGLIQTQLELLGDIVSQLQGAGCEPGIVHASGRFSKLQQPMTPLDAVQIGGAFFGHGNGGPDSELQRVAFVQTAVSELAWLSPGQAVGESKLIHVKKPTKVAVIPVGYLNGLGNSKQAPHRLLAALGAYRAAQKRSMKVGSGRARILGLPGATQTYLDVTNLECATGTSVSFFIDAQHARGLQKAFR